MRRDDFANLRPLADFLLKISVAEQKLWLLKKGKVIAEYPVSTSKFGIGFAKDSFKTPIGIFKIAEKIGDNAHVDQIFQSRRKSELYTGQHEGDLVMTRILWLEGIEAKNKNTKERYIYIHGTNHEECIGECASMGCVRMKRADIIELYDKVNVGCELVIEA